MDDLAAPEAPRAGRDEAVVISNGRLTARIVPFGASLADLRLAGHPYGLVLGFGTSAEYAAHAHYFGAVIGRYANRIAGARCEVAGETLALEANDGPHHLHGGRKGFARRVWDVAKQAADAVELRLRSEHGEAGYPGTLDVRARYSVEAAATLRLDLSAVSDRVTPLNLCHHPYFSFTPGDTGPTLMIAAERYLPSNDALIPLGDAAPVAGTPYDFRSARRVPSQGEAGHVRFNNTYCLAPSVGLRHAATLRSGRVAMQLWTTQPGLHFYDGYKISGCGAGPDGRQQGAYAGLCLEAQNWPDAPNRPGYPPALLQPGGRYFQRTEYRFALTA